jgi:phosphatidylglycerophosphatase C
VPHNLIGRQMARESPVVVFDLDLTLTNRDTAGGFFRWLLRRQPWRLLLTLVAVPMLAFGRGKWVALRYMVWVATLGQSEGRLQELLQIHIDEVLHTPAPIFRGDGLNRLSWHVAQGHRVVVATGCLEDLAKALLHRVGYGHVAVVGSTLQPYLGGMARKEHCFGATKISMLTQRGFPPPWAMTYTDSESDLPVLRLCEQRFLVNPNSKSVRLIREELEWEPVVLTWR